MKPEAEPLADILRRRREADEAERARIDALIERHALEYIEPMRYEIGGLHHRRLVRVMRRLIEEVNN